MGKILVIKNANFSANALGEVPAPSVDVVTFLLNANNRIMGVYPELYIRDDEKYVSFYFKVESGKKYTITKENVSDRFRVLYFTTELDESEIATTTEYTKLVKIDTILNESDSTNLTCTFISEYTAYVIVATTNSSQPNNVQVVVY